MSNIELNMVKLKMRSQSCWTNLSFGGVMWKKASVELSKYLDPHLIVIALTKMINKSAEIK